MTCCSAVVTRELGFPDRSTIAPTTCTTPLAAATAAAVAANGVARKRYAAHAHSANPARAIGLGKGIKSAADELGKKVAVVGSTDLTHYGRNYGFSPAGRGEKALKWVTEVNDRAFIDSLLEMNAEEALRHARESQSACSAGGAVAAMTYAGESGAAHGTLLCYMTSHDVHPNESFVGYAGITYAP